VREEHRIITALFADLAGSTALGERLREEEVKLVVGEAIGRVAAEIERLGGYVKDLAGDGVLAFFGAPTSYEDDAERAARAALNILQAIAAYGSEVARGWDVEELGVRVGISTGPSRSARSVRAGGWNTPPSATPSTRLRGFSLRPNAVRRSSMSTHTG